MTAGAPTIGPIAWAVVRVPPGRAGAWQALTGWAAATRRVGQAFAAALGASDAADLPLTVLTPPSGTGGLALIEAPGCVPAFRTLGWAAAELSVAGVDAIAARAVAGGFALAGPPRSLGSTASIAACQIVDPGGAVLYCADVRHYAGKAALVRATHPVERMFIAVLASADLDASRAWYAAQFGVEPVSDHAVPIAVLAQAWRSDPETRWRISSQQLAGECLIEIDHYPQDAGRRTCDAYGLPGGVCAVVFRAARDAAMAGPGGERIVLNRHGTLP